MKAARTSPPFAPGVIEPPPRRRRLTWRYWASWGVWLVLCLAIARFLYLVGQQ